MFRIATDSGADLSIDYMDGENILFMPMTFTMDGETFVDTRRDGLSSSDFYGMLREGKVSAE